MPVNRPQPISREDIAGVYEQMAVIAIKSDKNHLMFPGLVLGMEMQKAAESYREIDRMDDKRTLEEHKYYTQEAWRQNKRNKREEKSREELGKAAQILKVVK